MNKRLCMSRGVLYIEAEYGGVCSLVLVVVSMWYPVQHAGSLRFVGNMWWCSNQQVVIKKVLYICNRGRFQVENCWWYDRVALQLSGRAFARSAKGPGFEPRSSHKFSPGTYICHTTKCECDNYVRTVILRTSTRTVNDSNSLSLSHLASVHAPLYHITRTRVDKSHLKNKYAYFLLII